MTIHLKISNDSSKMVAICGKTGAAKYTKDQHLVTCPVCREQIEISNKNKNI